MTGIVFPSINNSFNREKIGEEKFLQNFPSFRSTISSIFLHYLLIFDLNIIFRGHGIKRSEMHFPRNTFTLAARRARNDLNGEFPSALSR